eukprot:6041807-Pleurochrysis_carterae.AAC.2
MHASSCDRRVELVSRVSEALCRGGELSHALLPASLAPSPPRISSPRYHPDTAHTWTLPAAAASHEVPALPLPHALLRVRVFLANA